MTDPDVPFPPLGNARLAGVAAADVFADPAFGELAASVAGAAPAPGASPELSAVVERFSAWISAAVVAANEAAFRFDLRGYEPTDPPRLATLGEGFAGELAPLGITGGRGTAKLEVAIGLRGTGRFEHVLVGVDRPSQLLAGNVLIWPSYLPAHAAHVDRGDLDVLLLRIHGPAFR